eukprot:gnl/TRDRNA2_/TRDRNA2_66921_c0_seq1.p1 gnl/TRDRNA2_/TRDRNA2_66921_c0~~gnl/TRDRNA2_/TRDRNA2_66921_c0_seq1.p1  ORF type:complete len:166 (-),score=41.56 gnl/TRDRNA2_/TRDRNA2_66921_c0_seq1:256-723(-)
MASDTIAAPLTEWQKHLLIRELDARGLVTTGRQSSTEYQALKKVLDNFDAGRIAFADVDEGAKAALVWGVPKVDFQKMLWVCEQAANPSRQPTIVKVPSGLTVQRQTSGFSIQRTVSAKWEERVLRIIEEVKLQPPPKLPECCASCFAGYMKLAE